MRKLLLFPAALILLTACTQTTWEKTGEGVIIRLRSKSPEIPRQMMLEVVNEDIIHVIASPENGFSEEKSLCVIDRDLHETIFQVKQERDTLVLATNKVRVKVSLETGQVTFCDENDIVLLREYPGGGKKFTPVNVEGTSGYAAQPGF